MTMEGEPGHWNCAVCGRPVHEVARVYCTSCSGHHEVCLDCAPDVEIDGQMRRVRDFTALRSQAEGGTGLVILNVGGKGALCTNAPVGSTQP